MKGRTTTEGEAGPSAAAFVALESTVDAPVAILSSGKPGGGKKRERKRDGTTGDVESGERKLRFCHSAGALP